MRHRHSLSDNNISQERAVHIKRTAKRAPQNATQGEPTTVGSSSVVPPQKEPPTGGKSPLESTRKPRFTFERLNLKAIERLHGTRSDCPNCGRPGWFDFSNVPFSSFVGNAIFWSKSLKRWECLDERNVNRGPRVVEFDAKMRRIN